MDAQLYKRKILIVDDEHFMRMLIIQALNSLGFHDVFEAESVAVALRQIRDEGPFDLILSDIDMKPNNGFDLVQRIRTGSTPQPYDSRVMFLTGLSDFATLTSASALDVQGFLVKPVSANLLHQKIREAFREKSKIKNPEDYGELLLSHSGAASTDASEENNEESQSEAEDQTDYQKVHLRELLSGWVLRQDIYAKGVLLLKNGTVLKPGAIMVLKDLATVLDDQYVVVECATEKS